MLELFQLHACMCVWSNLWRELSCALAARYGCAKSLLWLRLMPENQGARHTRPVQQVARCGWVSLLQILPDTEALPLSRDESVSRAMRVALLVWAGYYCVRFSLRENFTWWLQRVSVLLVGI